MNEEWKIVEAVPAYRVSNIGNVCRVDSGLLKKWIYQQRGYPMVSLRNRGISKRNYHVHRLVGEAFIEGRFPNAQLNHKDGNKNNPRADNLEWVTRSQNAIHAHRVLGVKFGFPKIAPLQSSQIRERIKKGESPAKLATEFSVNIATIYYHKYKSGG